MDGKHLQSESSTIPYVENDLDTYEGYYLFWWPTLSGQWNKKAINQDEFHQRLKLSKELVYMY